MRYGIRAKLLYNQEYVHAWTKDDDVYPRGAKLLLETEHGLEMAEVLCPPREVEEKNAGDWPIRIARAATEEDLARAAEFAAQDDPALLQFREKIKKHGLEMKAVSVHHFFEGGKVLFFFWSDKRVDFRNLVKDLAGTFHARIELRQIGVRDETQLIGGHGVCGLCLCCRSCRPMTSPVSIKMAKEQNLSLNSAKINGVCGKLLCCLTYEYDAYRELNKQFPRVGTKVWFGETKAVVKDLNYQARTVKVQTEDMQYIEFAVERIRVNKITGKKYIEPEDKAKPREAETAEGDGETETETEA